MATELPKLPKFFEVPKQDKFQVVETSSELRHWVPVCLTRGLCRGVRQLKLPPGGFRVALGSLGNL